MNVNNGLEIAKYDTLVLFATAKGINPESLEEINQLEKMINHLFNIHLVQASSDNPLSVKNLNIKIFNTVNTLHTHKFKSNTKQEAESALNFLELISLLGFYKNQLMHLTESKLKGRTNEQDGLVEDSLFHGESIRNNLVSKKENRKFLVNEIKELETKIEEIFSSRLESVDQMAFKKYATKALSILKSYAKS